MVSRGSTCGDRGVYGGVAGGVEGGVLEGALEGGVRGVLKVRGRMMA